MPISNWPSSSLRKPLPLPKSNFSQPVTLLSLKSSIGALSYSNTLALSTVIEEAGNAPVPSL